MNISRVATAMSIASVLFTSAAFAQTPSPPDSTSSPSSASSPSQREATHSPAKESSTSAPSDATTAHQRQAMAGKKMTMKECMDAHTAAQPTMARSDMTKACDMQMKNQKDSTAMPKPSATMPKGHETPATTPAPK
jgi:hypothetical protein